MTMVVAAVGLGVTGALTVALVVMCARFRRVERRTRQLETRLAAAERASADARAEAAVARRVARRAAQASGVDDAPTRIVFESLTGPVVRAVALGAGARRVITSLTRSRGPSNAPGAPS